MKHKLEARQTKIKTNWYDNETLYIIWYDMITLHDMITYITV